MCVICVVCDVRQQTNFRSVVNKVQGLFGISFQYGKCSFNEAVNCLSDPS
jgi:hypothetical protein